MLAIQHCELVGPVIGMAVDPTRDIHLALGSGHYACPRPEHFLSGFSGATAHAV